MNLAKVIFFPILIGGFLFGLLGFVQTTAQSDTMTTVKLYSGDKLVATWENASLGTVEGNTYVFTLRHQGRQVRICGTYSVEVVR
ncbi:MAG TPA: hypothetical protein VNN76_10260 [Bacteroidota bacterium]|nr:hypothetical protein [Bacteroidota bacterium]